MKIAAGILTYNLYDNGRIRLFDLTIESLAFADSIYLVDNGSTDGTAGLIRSMGGWSNPGNVHTCGYGMNLVAGVLAKTDADICISTNDDISWHADSRQILEDAWTRAPSLAIISGLLEPEYPWNQSLGTVGPVLVRETVPGGAWTWRRENHRLIFPVPTKTGWDDVPTCRRLTGQGFQVGCVDAATHIGEGRSTWGNASNRFELEPAAAVKARWGIS